MTGDFDRAVAEVVDSGACSGCGACCAIDPGMRMALARDGFLRPVRRDGGASPVDDDAAVREFAAVCPGRAVSSPRPEGAERHPQLGSYLEAWAVHATDPEQRHRGASGGALTALSAWLTTTGRVNRVVGAGPAPAPRRTVSVTITDRETALAAAGSRYAPVATLVDPQVLAAGTAVVAKPCEASALSRLAEIRNGVERPIILSFFCAGTPSQGATDDLVDELLPEPDDEVLSVRYRGCGWPGDFTVGTATGEHRMDYRRSWGDRLGPTMQWRCKICADGVGESADLVACDYWEVDAQGYPVFEEGDGRSGLLVRTERGREILHAALDAGVLRGEPLEAGRIAAVQPGQTWRRDNLGARLLGARLAGVRVPAYRGFPLLRLALRRPRQSFRAAKGAWRRARAARQR